MKSKSYILSRAYVEFGPLLEQELLVLDQRGVLQDRDYVRDVTIGDWLPIRQWRESMVSLAPALRSTKRPASTPVKAKRATKKKRASDSAD